jgi:uncharacterized protein YggE
MKKILIPILVILVSTGSFAQNINPYPKTTTVTGSAEMEVIPDEIYVQVDLKEYEKKGQGKVNIETIRRDILSAAKSIGIADSLISIASYDGYNGNPWLRKKNKKDELYASISYEIKFKESKQLDALVEKLDDNATSNFFIQRTSHSRLAEYRKQLKIAAVKAAKEKAEYLSAAIGETITNAVTINEPVEYYVPYYNMNRQTSNMRMKQDAAEMAPDVAPTDFKKIKLKYDVTVVFGLK